MGRTATATQLDQGRHRHRERDHYSYNYHAYDHHAQEDCIYDQCAYCENLLDCSFPIAYYFDFQVVRGNEVDNDDEKSPDAIGEECRSPYVMGSMRSTGART